MLARLHLVRHGEVHNPDHLVYADLPGFALGERGRREAAAVARRLTLSPIDVIATSPLQRAIETAAPLAAALGLEVRRDPRLTEWGLLRRWAGRSWEDLDDEFPGEVQAYLDHPDDLPFSPEPLAAVAARMTEVVAALGEAWPGGTAAIVSHQDPVQALRLALTGRSLGRLRLDKPGHGTVLTFEPGVPWTETDRWDPAY